MTKIDKSTESDSFSEIIFLFNDDQKKDAIRIIKAIMHLAKLSGASELPKVTENTF